MRRSPPPADWLMPSWNQPRVGALMSTRHGGVSAAPFDSTNLSLACGDDAVAVMRNRQLLQAVSGATPVYLQQVHGTSVVCLARADTQPGAPTHVADASVTSVAGVACTVMVADCLPVLFAAAGGRAVGAAHAGWRGLAGGVLEATLKQVCELADCAPGEVRAWLGACIGPTAFEVGADVPIAFGRDPTAPGPYFVAQREGKWLADLAGLAVERLQAAGVVNIGVDRGCTATDTSRFFSYRRSRLTGRMAALIWIESGGS